MRVSVGPHLGVFGALLYAAGAVIYAAIIVVAYIAAALIALGLLIIGRVRERRARALSQA